MPIFVGTRFGAYEVTSSLGSGSMGEVYRVRDTNSKTPALRPAAANDANHLPRFQREAEVPASLNHLNFAHINQTVQTMIGAVKGIAVKNKAVLVAKQLTVVLLSLLFVTGCGDGNGMPSSRTLPPNPIPEIATMSPTSVIAGGSDLSLTVSGANFMPGSTVRFGAVTVTPIQVGPTQLIVTVPAAAVATPGSASIAVINPSPGGGPSQEREFFTITGPLGGAFNAIGNMTTPRANHAAVLLANGKVLIVGGSDGTQALASAELYDPSTRAFVATGSMLTARYSPSAALLSNDKVLVAGGAADLSAEIYDPATGTFSATGSLMSGGTNELNLVPLTLLQNGKVLAVGVNAQIYDPATGTFSPTVPYPDPSSAWGTSNLLHDGRVLLTGCASRCTKGAAALYDPATSTFGATQAIRDWDDVNTGTTLLNGTVLIAGSSDDGLPTNEELYDPVAGTFTSLPDTSSWHEFAAAVRLLNGAVLITGGQLAGGHGSADADLYEPATGDFAVAANMIAGRHAHTATLLPDGTVLIAGGHTVWPASTGSAEIYTPTQ